MHGEEEEEDKEEGFRTLVSGNPSATNMKHDKNFNYQ